MQAFKPNDHWTLKNILSNIFFRKNDAPSKRMSKNENRSCQPKENQQKQKYKLGALNIAKVMKFILENICHYWKLSTNQRSSKYCFVRISAPATLIIWVQSTQGSGKIITFYWIFSAGGCVGIIFGYQVLKYLRTEY